MQVYSRAYRGPGLSRFEWIERFTADLKPVIRRIPKCIFGVDATSMRLMHCHQLHARPDVTGRELAFSLAIRARCLAEAGQVVTSEELHASYKGGERPGVVSSIFGDDVPLTVSEAIKLTAINLCPAFGEVMHERGQLSSSPACILAAVYFMEYAAANFDPLPFGRRQARASILRNICAWRCANFRDYGPIVQFLMDRKNYSLRVNKLLQSCKPQQHASDEDVDHGYRQLREALFGLTFLPQLEDEGASS